MTALAAPLLAAFVLAAGAGAPTLRPAITTHPSYGETFTFVVDLDDGTYLQLSFGFTNLGPGSLKAICRAIVTDAAGKPWRASTHVGRDGWSWRGGEDERLTIGPCAAWVGRDGTGVEVGLDGAAIRLALAARPERRATPDPLVVVGHDAYRAEVLLSRAVVSGSVALPGRAERAVSGAGYLDHSRSTVKGRDLARRWVRFRALRGVRGLLVLGREGHDGRFGPVWSCDDPGPCRRHPSFRVERAGAPEAPSFRVAVGDGERPLEVDSGRLLYRDAPIEDLGLLGKVVAPFLGAPVTWVYRARAAVDGAPPVEGVLEVELAAE